MKISLKIIFLILLVVPYSALAADALNIKEVQVGNEIIRKVTPVYNTEKPQTSPIVPVYPKDECPPAYPVFKTQNTSPVVPVYKAVDTSEVVPVYKAVSTSERLPVFKAQNTSEVVPVYKAVTESEVVPVYRNGEDPVSYSQTEATPLPATGAREYVFASFGIAALILVYRYWVTSVKKYRQSHFF